MRPLGFGRIQTGPAADASPPAGPSSPSGARTRSGRRSRPRTATRRGWISATSRSSSRAPARSSSRLSSAGVAGRARGDVGDADAVAPAASPSSSGAQQARREPGGVQRGVEAVARAREVVADLGRAQPRVDARRRGRRVRADDRRAQEHARVRVTLLCAWSASRSTSRRPCSTICATGWSARAGRARRRARPGRRATDLAYLRELTAYWRLTGSTGAQREREAEPLARSSSPRSAACAIHFVHVARRRHPADPHPRLAERVHRAICRWSSACRGVRPRDPVAARLRVLRAPGRAAPRATSPRSGTR